MSVHIGLLLALIASYEAMRVEDESHRLEGEEGLYTGQDCTSKTEAGCCKKADVTKKDPSAYFNQKHAELKQDLEDAADVCSQKDVCHLMRQLDMEFYLKAKAGQLEDFHLQEGSVPAPTVIDKTPTLESDNMSLGPQWRDMCHEASTAFLTKGGGLGFRVGAIYDLATCAEKSGKTTKQIKDISDVSYPPGCFTIDGKGAYMNAARLKESPLAKENPAKVVSASSDKLKTWCVMDRSLSSTAANYYSPYKMKSNGEDATAFGFQPKMSTSCSIGMMADLAHQGLTESACASILARRKGTEKEWFERSKLIQIITNDWCPNVWTNAGETMCMVDRKAKAMVATKSLDQAGKTDRTNRLANMFPDKTFFKKFALTDASCDSMGTTSLKDQIGEEEYGARDETKAPKWTVKTARG